MELIRISDSVYINPQMISKVEYKNFGSKKQLLVRIDGEEILADITPMELLKSLQKSGCSVDISKIQFWAG